MRQDDDRIDLSALDPENDPVRLERVMSGVLERLGPGILEDPVPLRRQVHRVLARRFQPLFGTASLVAAAAAILLLRSVDPADSAPDPMASGVVATPAEWAAWLLTESAPRAEDLLFLATGDDR